MTIKKSFALYMQDVLNLGTTVGTNRNIYKNGVPQSAKAPDRCWWIIQLPGSPTRRNATGEREKDYALNIYYRNTDEEDIDEVLQAFEETLNSKYCPILTGFDVLEIRASGLGSDQDLDGEDRFIGLVQVTITVHQHD